MTATTATSHRPWRPVLAGAAARRAFAAAAAVVETLAEPSERTRASSHDIALLHAYSASVMRDSAGSDRARAFLDQAAERVANEVVAPCLLDGLAGIGWSFTHLADPEDVDDAAAAVDDALVMLARRTPWTATFGLVSGLIGFVVYALKRRTPAAVELIHLLVARLRELAVIDGEGWRWPTNGLVDLGIAHGLAGVVAVLARVFAAGIERAQVAEMLEGSVRWLVHRRRSMDRVSERAAWCYGDPGIALALFGASQAIGDLALRAAALELAHVAASRPMDECGVVDATMCHGAAGLGHMFNRLYQETSDERLLEASARWHVRALAFGRSGSSTEPFPALGVGGRWTDDLSLSGGSTGVALALLAAAGDVAPDWDEVMLMGVPSGR